MAADESNNLAIVVASVAGLFSLLGAFSGAALSRKTEYFKWLRQNQSEVFSEFLERLQAARQQATNAIYENNLQSIERDIKITEIYSSPLHHSRKVRLYLPKEKREEFSLLVREIWSLHASIGLGQTRLGSIEDKIDKVQEIFEIALRG